MRITRLKHTSIIIAISLIFVAVLFTLLRTFVMHSGDSFADEGSDLFISKGCAQCHYTDSRRTKAGPGLKGLFKQDKLPMSQRKATEENVRSQLEDPYRNMPSFADRLSEKETNQLIGYLKTL
jgi:cytochrome c2